MFGPPGHAYIYLSYGMHLCFNAVTGLEGVAEAVLGRALEPLEGLELMLRRRGIMGPPEENMERERRRVASGPGNLTRALGVSLRHNRLDLTASPLRIEDHGLPRRPSGWSRRIGITVGVEPEWRVYALDSAAVSGRVRSQEVRR